MCVADILKLTLLAVGIIIVTHLILNILIRQDTKEHFKAEKKVTFEEKNNMDLNDIKNDLQSWINESQQPTETNEIDKIFNETKVTFKQYNEEDEIDKLTIRPQIQQPTMTTHDPTPINQENELKNWNEPEPITQKLEDLPKPDTKPDYIFKPANPTITENEPMAWNSAESFQDKKDDGELYAWDGGFDSANYSTF